MTKIRELGEKYAQLPVILEQYQKEMAEVEVQLALKGKRLDLANSENSTLQLYYDQRKVELATLTKFMEAQVNRVRGNLFKNLSQTNQKDLSDRAKDKFIDNEKGYLDIYELYLEIEEMYKKYQAIVDAFTSRGYALNNITKIRVASLEDAMI